MHLDINPEIDYDTPTSPSYTQGMRYPRVYFITTHWVRAVYPEHPQVFAENRSEPDTLHRGGNDPHAIDGKIDQTRYEYRGDNTPMQSMGKTFGHDTLQRDSNGPQAIDGKIDQTRYEYRGDNTPMQSMGKTIAPGVPGGLNKAAPAKTWDSSKKPTGSTHKIPGLTPGFKPRLAHGQTCMNPGLAPTRPKQGLQPHRMYGET